MGREYVPTVMISSATMVRKSRTLPLPGEVHVKVGEKVDPDTVVAGTNIPGDYRFINVPYEMKIESSEILECMVKKIGDKVEKGEIIASYKRFFGLLKTECRSPTTGTLFSLSKLTGRLAIQEPPIPVEINAHIPGKVIEILPGRGVIIECPAAFIQGIFGIGGEQRGEILMLAKSPDEVLTEEKIYPECAGKVVVGGSLVTKGGLEKALKVGAAGVVVGGIVGKELTDFLGYEIGVAITGQEDINTTLVVTEGFGKTNMFKRRFDLLKLFEGQLACINGATQIRAGVIRPEVIIPQEGLSKTREAASSGDRLDLEVRVRITREPYFGYSGDVMELPIAKQEIDTMSVVKVLKVKLDDGRDVIVPTTNVEILRE